MSLYKYLRITPYNFDSDSPPNLLTHPAHLHKHWPLMSSSSSSASYTYYSSSSSSTVPKTPGAPYMGTIPLPPVEDDKYYYASLRSSSLSNSSYSPCSNTVLFPPAERLPTPPPETSPSTGTRRKQGGGSSQTSTSYYSTSSRRWRRTYPLSRVPTTGRMSVPFSSSLRVPPFLIATMVLNFPNVGSIFPPLHHSYSALSKSLYCAATSCITVSVTGISWTCLSHSYPVSVSTTIYAYAWQVFIWSPRPPTDWMRGHKRRYLIGGFSFSTRIGSLQFWISSLPPQIFLLCCLSPLPCLSPLLSDFWFHLASSFSPISSKHLHLSSSYV